MKSPYVIFPNQTIRIFVLLLFVLLPALLMMQTPVQAAIGVDGDLTIPAGDPVVLNRYANVLASDSATDTITVGNIDDLDDGLGHFENADLSSGDMILIYQAQGAAFTNVTDSPAYGSFTPQSAGHYEFAIVASVVGNVITVETSNAPPYACAGLSNTYDPANGNVQVIRVPQYTNLTIPNGATVTAVPWDGTRGGVVALHVQYNLVVDGAIDTSGMGFRGGDPVDAGPNDPVRGEVTYRIANSRNAGEKGESILGFRAVYDASNGRFARGAPANGGGGGNAHNSGGGGGANGFSGSVTWTGQGFVAVDDIYATAWDLDDTIVNGSVPTYFQGGAGGGRGGYSFSDNYQDATVTPPGNSLWNDQYGDSRREVGGLGGRPVTNNPSSNLFLGGGGGGGDGNNGAASSGASGGGLAILIAENTLGTGSILSDGNSAANTTLINDDGAGGGGAGGTIVLKTKNLSTNTLTVSANGGKGGDQLLVPGYPFEAMGPGGGGGGGYIAAASANGSLTPTVAGGNNGVTGSDALDEFPPNGATKGYAGDATNLTFTNANAFSFPGCQTPTAITLQTFSATANSGWLLPITFTSLMVVTFVVLTSSGRRKKSTGN